MEKIKHLIYFKEMKRIDYLFCVCLLFLPILLIFIPNSSSVILITGVPIVYLICLLTSKILLKTDSERYKRLPNDYKIFVAISIFVLIGVIVFRLGIVNRISESNQFFYPIVFIAAFTLLAYMYGWWLFFKFCFVVIYYILLKILFPEESDQTENYLSIKELSKFIKVYDQKRYLNTAIINFIVYIFSVGYFFSWLISLVEIQDHIIEVIVEFAEKLFIVNFGNTLGLISVIIAIYTITYSIQTKIYDKAVEVYNLNRE
ncbi:hypothetical protein [Lysinibacillus sp. NPDC047702]|uniref:hypothetical protein n=1 Tax=unclassified Lysinibacillus TaxID=2636778 RepID=UPI003D00498C